MATRWSDDTFLDELRRSIDLPADTCVAALSTDNDYAGLFRKAGLNTSVLPDDAPAALRDFWATHDLAIKLETDLTRFPDALDRGRLERGERVFLDHAVFAAIVLLAKALPEGYAAPCLSTLLNLSGNLRTQPYRRLLAVLQLVLDVTALGGFEKGGRAIAAARQARLMHAGIRKFAPAKLPGYEVRFRGPPVNFEDMLGTIMGLSLLVIDGLPKINDALSERDAEDYYYLWRAFAVAMGIHPPGQHGTPDWVPATLDEAREFYASYERRHYEHDPANNPDGVALAEENLRMLHDLLPWPLQFPGVRRIPDLFMTQLVGDEGCRRVGVEPAHVPFGLRTITVTVLDAAIDIGRALDDIDPHGNFHPTLSTMLLQDMIKKQYGGTVTFEIPESIRQVRELVDEPGAAGNAQAEPSRPAPA